jgi:hypothetical protein
LAERNPTSKSKTEYSPAKDTEENLFQWFSVMIAESFLWTKKVFLSLFQT